MEDVKSKPILKKEATLNKHRVSFAIEDDKCSLKMLEEVNADLISLFTHIEQILPCTSKDYSNDTLNYIEYTFRPEKTYSEIGIQAIKEDEEVITPPKQFKEDKMKDKEVYSTTKIYRPLFSSYYIQRQFRSIEDFYKRNNINNRIESIEQFYLTK